MILHSLVLSYELISSPNLLITGKFLIYSYSYIILFLNSDYSTFTSFKKIDKSFYMLSKYKYDK